MLNLPSAVLTEYLISLKKTFFSRYVSLKKFLNLFSVALQYLFKVSEVRGYPIKAVLDPTNACQLKCPLCPVGRGDKSRDIGFMSFETFKKVVDEIGQYLLQIDLYNWGEPLLNREIFKMVEYANSKRIRTRISTNLINLSEDDTESMIKSGLDEIIVSIDGASEETYKVYKVGGSFSKVIQNIKLIQKKKEELRAKNPEVVWQFLIMKQNECELKEAESLAKKLKVRFRKIPTRADMGIEVFLSDEEKIKRFSDWFPSEKFSRYDIKKKRRKIRPRSCFFLWTYIVVNWDGSVSPCCSIYPKKYDFGDIKEGVLKVWNNEKYKMAREIVRKKIIDERVVCSFCVKNGFLEA